MKFFLDENKKHGKNNGFNNFLHFYNMTNNLDKPTEDYGTFRMTTILIKRARELMDGAPSLIGADTSDPVQAAFEEFASGKLNITGDVVTEGK
ncbi:MAG: DNA-directed RNA polymerase subunit omega [Candidatus Scalindua sp.]|nr:DNA-directed RNA polymerase subunit omega [Candidatus Scalindua sp.]MCR4344042.1 DNA-directed RNA polymerase subunit omega [Candidatus Scalindua sp.]